MKAYLELGSCPVNEECIQVNRTKEYIDNMREQCLKYKNLLLKKFPNMPQNNSFSIKSFQHDFGTYLEVVVNYNDKDSKSIDFAFNVESNLPLYWNEC